MKYYACTKIYIYSDDVYVNVKKKNINWEIDALVHEKMQQLGCCNSELLTLSSPVEGSHSRSREVMDTIHGSQPGL